MSRKKARASAGQLSLFPQRAARRGAGRPKTGKAGVPHRSRPSLSRHHPVHVTLRVHREAQGFRGAKAFRAVRRALCAAREQFGFRLVQYSVQGNHIHLIAEANDRVALTRGVQGLTIRVALGVNKARARRGRVFGDRYHARQLRTPLEVRRALLYVLNNERHHVAQRGLSLPPWRFDSFSSAHEFDGWRDSELLEMARAAHERERRDATQRADGDARADRRNAEGRTTAEPRSFLLRVGWRRHGLLGVDEAPAARSARRLAP